ncbi:MAG: flagellar motor protein MotB [Bradymonadia bacterium]|jgi:flagellar motor protein MotB
MNQEEEEAAAGPVWMTFADLMSSLLGVFVLLMLWIVVFQVDLAKSLEDAQSQREVAMKQAAVAEAERRVEAERRTALEAKSKQAKQRLVDLEDALAGSLAAGRVTLGPDGRIGIAGSLLFGLYSAQLTDSGSAVIGELAPPLGRWLAQHDEMVMVGGFTDDLPIRGAERRFTDNWQLSTERALTVVRALKAAGVPPERLFAAGFGAHHPAVPNTDETSRSRNRRVEIVPQSRR